MYNVIFEHMFIRSVDDLRLFVGCRGLPAPDTGSGNT